MTPGERQLARQQHWESRLWLADHLGRTVSELDTMPVAEFHVLIFWHAERNKR
jgi:hypothetical protein